MELEIELTNWILYSLLYHKTDCRGFNNFLSIILAINYFGSVLALKILNKKN